MWRNESVGGLVQRHLFFASYAFWLLRAPYFLAASAWGIVVLRKAVPDPRAASLRAFFRLSIVLYAVRKTKSQVQGSRQLRESTYGR